jgi:hypothetical protein
MENTIIKERIRERIREKRNKIREKKKELNQKLQEESCKILEKYVNIDLNINITGTSQNTATEQTIYDMCAELFVKENIKLYITFNALNYATQTKLEETAFNQKCTTLDCKFYSIPVADFTAPTEIQLLNFWEILDDFHTNRRFKDNVLMHCTAGHGRTGYMILSYIWLRAALNNSKYFPWRKNNNPISIYDYATKPDIIKNKSTVENIMKDEIMIFISNEIKTKYSNSSYNEIFVDPLEDDTFVNLFFNRLNIFCKTFILYISKNIQINNNMMSIPFNGLLTSKNNDIMKLVMNIIDNFNRISSYYNIFNSKSNINNLKVNNNSKIENQIIYTTNNAFLFGNNTFLIYQKMFKNIGYKIIYKLPQFLQWNILFLIKDNSKISITKINKIIISYINELYTILKNSLLYEFDGDVLFNYIRNKNLKYIHPSKKICLLMKEISDNIIRVRICIAYEKSGKKEIDYIIELILYKSNDISSLNIIETLKYNCIKYNIINNLPKKYFVLKLENLIKSTFDNLINKTCLDHISGYYEFNILKYIFSYKNIDKKIVDFNNLEREYNIIESIK